MPHASPPQAGTGATALEPASAHFSASVVSPLTSRYGSSRLRVL